MLVRGLQVAGAFERDPLEAFERARDQIFERRDLRTAVPAYVPDEHWVATLRDELGARSGGDEDAEFDQVWQELEDRFAQLHLPLGRGTFGGWDDGDRPLREQPGRSFVGSAQCGGRTGVGEASLRGDPPALSRNRHDHLWSIDVLASRAWVRRRDRGGRLDVGRPSLDFHSRIEQAAARELLVG